MENIKGISFNIDRFEQFGFFGVPYYIGINDEKNTVQAKFMGEERLSSETFMFYDLIKSVIEEVQILNWEERYEDPYFRVEPSIEWEVIIHSFDGNEMRFSGKDVYPDTFFEFKELYETAGFHYYLTKE